MADGAAPVAPVAAVAAVSHRERKKARTRATLIEVSQRLFAEQGYTATTLEEISEAVDIRTQTLLRYFASKAHLALAPMIDTLDDLRTYFLDPARPLDTLTAWREYMAVEAQEVSTPSTEALTSYVHNMREFRRWADRDPVLVAMTSDIDRQLREVLAESLVHDGRLAGDDLHSTLVAALLVAGRTAIYERWLDHEPDTLSLVDDQLAVIDYAVASLSRPATGRLVSVATS